MMARAIRLWWHTIVAFLIFALSAAVARITMHQDALDGGYPPSEPVIPEINGAFTVKLVVRVDKINGLSNQVMFDFGNGPSTNNILLRQRQMSTDVSFCQYTGTGQPIYELVVANALTVGTTDTWEAAIEITGRMTLKKNGVLLGGVASGVVPLPGQTRSDMLLGRSNNWPGHTVLQGAILGLQVVNHGTVVSPIQKMQLLNLPSQIYGQSFVASAYVRFDNLAANRNYQRIFDFGNGTNDNIIFSQYLNLNQVRLVVFNSQGLPFECAASLVLVQGQMALWRVEVTASGIFRIEKNGVLLNECDNSGLVRESVFRHDLRVGESNYGGDDKTQGVIVGLRVDAGSFTSS